MVVCWSVNDLRLKVPQPNDEHLKRMAWGWVVARYSSYVAQEGKKIAR